VAPIASALLVELFVSLLQHPQGAAAPAPTTQDVERDEHPLGVVPHQIRGFLARFENLSVTGKSYQSCSACSDRIVDAYREQGWDFVQRALNEKGYVEELSGLKEVSKLPESSSHGLTLTHLRFTRRRKQLSRTSIGMKDPTMKRSKYFERHACTFSVGFDVLFMGDASHFMAFAPGQRRRTLWIPIDCFSHCLILGQAKRTLRDDSGFNR
jgi:hypothetical protein